MYGRNSGIHTHQSKYNALGRYFLTSSAECANQSFNHSSVGIIPRSPRSMAYKPLRFSTVAIGP